MNLEEFDKDCTQRIPLARRPAHEVHHKERDEVASNQTADLLSIFHCQMKPYLLKRVSLNPVKDQPYGSIRKEQQFIQNNHTWICDLFVHNVGENRREWMTVENVKNCFKYMIMVALRWNDASSKWRWYGLSLEDWEIADLARNMVKIYFAGPDAVSNSAICN